MEIEVIREYIPFIATCVLLYLLQMNVFVRTEKLEKVHREILDEVEKKYATKETSEHFRTQISDIQIKIDKIYDKLIGEKHE